MSSFLLYLSYFLLLAIQLATLFTPVPMSLQMLLSASLCVYIGCSLSLSQEVAEKLTQGDAMQFPLVAGAALCALFVAFKYFSAEWTNLLLHAYFCVAGVATVGQLAAPLLRPFLPAASRDAVVLDLQLPMGLERLRLTLTEAVCLLPGAAGAAWYGLTRHYIGSNLLGISFAVEGLRRLSLGSYATGAILLGLLFVYDIVMVFGTPLMVTVATKLDGPIKLLFPRGLADPITGKIAHSLLGLGEGGGGGGGGKRRC